MYHEDDGDFFDEEKVLNNVCVCTLFVKAVSSFSKIHKKEND